MIMSVIVLLVKVLLVGALSLGFAALGVLVMFSLLGTDYAILKFILIIFPYMTLVNKYILFPVENRLGVRSRQNQTSRS